MCLDLRFLLLLKWGDTDRQLRREITQHQEWGVGLTMPVPSHSATSTQPGGDTDIPGDLLPVNPGTAPCIVLK